jgi:hypothetical protein
MAARTEFNPIIFAILISCFFALLIYWFRTSIIAWQAKRWPKVKGIITVTPRESEIHGGSGLQTKIGAIVKLQYEYEVNGIQYTGNTISFNPMITNNPTLLSKYLEFYEKGEEVDVYYNPKNPDISVLRT